MDAVLDRFSLGNGLEQEVRALATRFDPVIAVLGSVQLESKSLAPEGCDQERVGAVDDDVLQAKSHGGSLAVDPGAEDRVANGAYLRRRLVPAKRVLEAAAGDAGKIEVASHRLLDPVLPVVRVDEVAVDAVLDGEPEA